MDFVYGPDQQRWYTELLSGDTITRSTVYVGNYEKITEDGKKGGNAADCKKNGAMHPYLSFYDYLCRRLMETGCPVAVSGYHRAVGACAVRHGCPHIHHATEQKNEKDYL